ncbi:hypothetical protein GP486_002605 [Trichoglossum hirsutum]|uniref:ADP-ribosylation factor n=1 Tax=Trichoglossum hirsutum TaxID=265104 RepID=A0A9P8RRJ8_9PEZI|nr:hypothetical protein GP486_002605 [Trichoglossum hirsutum]
MKRLAGASLLVFANKTDVGGCMTPEEIREGLQLDAIKTHKWTIIRCSAITGENLKEGLDHKQYRQCFRAQADWPHGPSGTPA